MAKLRHNAVIAQGGGPTAVINETVVGVVAGLRRCGRKGKTLGAFRGVDGILDEDFFDFDTWPGDIERVARTPSAALASTRTEPTDRICARIFEVFVKHKIRVFFYIGGNDTAAACEIIGGLAQDHGHELRVFHLPKTIDNDLVCNDHTPGFPSAARFVAMATLGDNLDNAALGGVKINVLMGRHSGFLAAASCMARQREGDGPHLIYLPERSFSEEQFLDDVQRVYDARERAVVAVSEGLRQDGVEVTAELAVSISRRRGGRVMHTRGEANHCGHVQLSGTGVLGDYLANLVRQKLKIKRVRADTYGYLQRSFPVRSPVDEQEARLVGEKAAELASSSEAGGSLVVRRVSSEPYASEIGLVPLHEVAGKTRTMESAFIADSGNDVTDAYVQYLRPLLGALPAAGRLR